MSRPLLLTGLFALVLTLPACKSARSDHSIYKTPESSCTYPRRSSGERATLLDSGVMVSWAPPEVADAGTDITWELSLDNTSAESRTCHVVLASNFIEYNGRFVSELDRIDTNIVLGPGQVDSVQLVVDESEYLPWTSVLRTFETTAFVEVLATPDVWLDDGRTFLTTPDIVLSLIPGSPVPVNSTVTCESTFTNPLSVDMQNVVIRYTVGVPLSISGAQESESNLGTVTPNETVVFSQEILAEEFGTHVISVSVNSDELGDLHGSIELEVLGDCNNDGIPDRQGIDEGFSSYGSRAALPMRTMRRLAFRTPLQRVSWSGGCRQFRKPAGG